MPQTKFSAADLARRRLLALESQFEKTMLWPRTAMIEEKITSRRAVRHAIIHKVELAEVLIHEK
jgi:hypothetical protein